MCLLLSFLELQVDQKCQKHCPIGFSNTLQMRSKVWRNHVPPQLAFGQRAPIRCGKRETLWVLSVLGLHASGAFSACVLLVHGVSVEVLVRRKQPRKLPQRRRRRQRPRKLLEKQWKRPNAYITLGRRWVNPGRGSQSMCATGC